MSETTIVSPTYVPDLVHATLDLLLDGETGIWHLSNEGALSWHEFAREFADRAKLDPSRIVAKSSERRDTSLASTRGFLLRPLPQAIDEYIAQSKALRELA